MKYVTLVHNVADETGLFAGILFKRAYEYAEVRVSKHFIIERYTDYLYKGEVPEIVVDYLIDILSHRTS